MGEDTGKEGKSLLKRPGSSGEQGEEMEDRILIYERRAQR